MMPTHNNVKYLKQLKPLVLLDGYSTKTIYRKIFSVTNSYSNNVKRKVIKILGIKISVKCKQKLSPFKKLMSEKITKRNVIVIEANGVHSETIPGLIKYLYELGYVVDVVVSDKILEENPFINFNQKYYRNLVGLNTKQFRQFLSSSKIKEYEYGLINSNYVYRGKTIETAPSIFEFFHNIASPYNGFIVLEHHLDRINEVLLAEHRVLQLADFKNIKKENLIFCNSHYFGQFKKHKLNKVVNFITIGALEAFRRNVDMLIDAVSQLKTNGIDNFKITVIGRGEMDGLPEDIKKYFNILGRVPFERMYEEINNADYFLTLLDSSNPKHNRYCQDGTSGSFQLIYGFNIPCLIEEKFADKHHFNDDNAIIIKPGETLYSAMVKAINMSSSEYDKVKQKLNKTAKYIACKSKNNLKMALNYKRYMIVSLGNDSLPEMICTKEGLKKTKMQCEISMPFDFCVTPTNALIDILNNNFSDYFKGLTFDVEQNIWFNKKYGIRYDHDDDYSALDKDKLIDRLKWRIENFQSIMKSDNFIYFVLNNPDNIEQLQTLYKILVRMRGRKPFKLIVLDLDAKLDNISNKNIYVYKKHHPFNETHDWRQPENLDLFDRYSTDIGRFIYESIASKFTPLNYSNLKFFDYTYENS